MCATGNTAPEEALRQIDEKDYPFKYYDARTICKIGANFSTELRELTGWIIEASYLKSPTFW